jgi:GNAT superfamily N-acetyltransferase
MIEFLPARASDWGDLVSLRQQTEQTMRRTGLYTEPQLADGLEQLRMRFDRGAMWIAINDEGIVVGAIGLDEPDNRLWDDPGHEALYLYKVMAVQGIGLLGQLVEFAENYARQINRNLLRLDCLQGNPKLHNLWKSQGFEYLCTVQVAGYAAGALFEKSLD